MNQENQYQAQTLNGLLEITLDSAEGYEEASNLARNPRFKSLFQERAENRRAVARELEQAIVDQGAQPVDAGSMLGQAHRVFVALRDKMSGNSDKALVEEVERGETVIQDKYRAAGRDEALSGDTRALVERLLSAVSADCDRIRSVSAEFH